MVESDIELIIRYLENEDDIAAAYLFGSQARGTQRDRSDIDVAVLFSGGGDKRARFDRRLEIIIALERTLGKRVDVIDIQAAPLLLQHHILLDGRLLVDKHRRHRVDFEVASRRRYFDLKPLLERRNAKMIARILEANQNGTEEVMSLDCQRVTENLVHWIRQQAEQAGAQGLVVGLSGGVDSAVVAALCQRAFPHACLGVIMPCYSDPKDREDAHLVADTLSLAVQEVDLSPVFALLYQKLTGEEYGGQKGLPIANLKPRLRMLTLYYFANSKNYLVAGTGNKSELVMGYFTKYGDGGVDILPLGDLVKTQVRELARYLNVPEPIIAKPPSAGLWPAQTDEGEMGITYADLDAVILGQAPSSELAHEVARRRELSQHKRSLPAIATWTELEK